MNSESISEKMDIPKQPVLYRYCRYTEKQDIPDEYKKLQITILDEYLLVPVDVYKKFNRINLIKNSIWQRNPLM